MKLSSGREVTNDELSDVAKLMLDESIYREDSEEALDEVKDQLTDEARTPHYTIEEVCEMLKFVHDVVSYAGKDANIQLSRIYSNIARQIKAKEDAVLKYPGNDNYGYPRANFIIKLQGLDEKHLYADTEQMIWLSSFSNNNPKSDYHWQCTACFNECERRGRKDIYERAFKEASEQ